MASVSLLALTACAVDPEPLTTEQHAERAAADMGELFAEQEPLSGPIGLHEAMARAVKYNLDNRLKLMEGAMQARVVDVARLDMLPALTAQAGWDERSNQNASNSKSLSTGRQSLPLSSSTDRAKSTADITLSWNILDFGLSYVRAQQEADRTLIVEERRRKVAQNIIQDTRNSFWKAVSADRLLKRVEPLGQRLEEALANARTIEEKRLQPPMESLTYRRRLLDMLREIQGLRRELVAAKTQLAATIGLRPGQSFELSVEPGAFVEPKLGLKLDDIERLALVNRPELREETYQARIGAKDVKAAMLSMLPGLTFSGGYNYDSNSYLMNDNWWSWGAKVSQNLVKSALSGPAKMRQAEAAEEVARIRRLGLSMAVISQAHISWLTFSQWTAEFRTASELHDIEQAIVKQVEAQKATEKLSEADLIEAELRAVGAELRRDNAFSEMDTAIGRIFVTAGADPLPTTVDGHDLKTLAKAIKSTMDGWQQGRINASGEVVPDAVQPAEKPADRAAPAVAVAPSSGPVTKIVAPPPARPSVSAVPGGHDVQAATAPAKAAMAEPELVQPTGRATVVKASVPEPQQVAAVIPPVPAKPVRVVETRILRGAVDGLGSP